MVRTRHLSAPEDRAVPAGQGHQARAHLAVVVRGDGARQDPAAHAERDAGAARGASQPSERLVARYGAAVARARAGQVGRSGAAEAGGNARREQPAGAHSRAVDPGRARRARRVVRPRTAEGRGSADSHPGDPRQRDALQGR